MIKSAMSSWKEFLEPRFTERIFLDDRSPERGAIRLLASLKLLDMFDRVQYCTVDYPPRSNFGIVGSLELANMKYIVHLDDDVTIHGTIIECENLINRAINIMEGDDSILGVNLLSLNPSVQGTEWLPTAPYLRAPDVYHPKKYFGTAACVVKSKLLDRAKFAQVLAWKGQQATVWEKFVTNDPSEFLTGEMETPFGVPDTSYFLNAAHEVTRKVR